MANEIIKKSVAKQTYVAVVENQYMASENPFIDFSQKIIGDIDKLQELAKRAILHHDYSADNVTEYVAEYYGADEFKTLGLNLDSSAEDIYETVYGKLHMQEPLALTAIINGYSDLKITIKTYDAIETAVDDAVYHGELQNKCGGKSVTCQSCLHACDKNGVWSESDTFKILSKDENLRYCSDKGGRLPMEDGIINKDDTRCLNWIARGSLEANIFIQWELDSRRSRHIAACEACEDA